MPAPDKPERPDLTGWRRRQQLRRSSAAQPIPSGKAYRRKPKHARDQGFHAAHR